MSYTVVFKPTAEKELDELPEYIAKKVSYVVDNLQINPRPFGSKKLVGMSNVWRQRVGDYRILYEIHDNMSLVRVLRVRHRKEAYQ